jgi:hypothetical protein
MARRHIAYRHDVLNKVAKCQTERASSWHSDIAVKAIHVTRAHRAQKRNFARMRHSKTHCHIGRSIKFGPRNFRI